MAEHKIARISLGKALVHISLTTLAAIGSATGNVWLAGATALPAALSASSETLAALLKKQPETELELPAPPFWTRDASSWQNVCSTLEAKLPTLLDTVADQIKQTQGVLSEADIQQRLIHAIADGLPTWEVPFQERGMVASYVTRLLFPQVAETLKPLLSQMQQDAQTQMLLQALALFHQMQQPVALASVAPVAPSQAPGTASTASVATLLEQKMQAEAYDIYICYHEEDEAEVLPIGEALKAQGILPWFDFLATPGKIRRKQQGELIERIPAAAICVGQHAIAHWQEMQMYAFLEQFVERGCAVMPVLLKSAPTKPKLPPFLGVLVWVDFRRSVPDPLQLMIRGIPTKER